MSRTTQLESVMEASRSLQELELEQVVLSNRLEQLETELRFWRTELLMRIQRLDASSPTEDPKNFSITS